MPDLPTREETVDRVYGVVDKPDVRVVLDSLSLLDLAAEMQRRGAVVRAVAEFSELDPIAPGALGWQIHFTAPRLPDPPA